MPENKREEVKSKIDKAIANKPEPEQEETPEEEKDKPVIWTPFARKIYSDIKLYIAKLGDSHPTRAVATKFHADIEDKLEDGKEKDSMIKYYNKVFKLPGVSTVAWNYFAESVINPKELSKGWNKVKDSLPPMTDKELNRSDMFLIFDGKEIHIGYLQYDHIDPKEETPVWKEKGRDAYTIKNITHFMVLPKPPISENILSDGVNESKMTPRQKWDEMNYWKRNAFIRKYFTSSLMEVRNKIAEKSYSELETEKAKNILDIIDANVLSFKI